MKTTTIRNLFAAVILAGLSAVTGCASFLPSLHQAAEQGKTGLVKQLIINGADVNAKDKHDATPLHAAAYSGKTETLLALIKHGADIDAKIRNGWTALHIAAKINQTDVALVLVNAGADIDAKNDAGRTPLHIAVQEGKAEIIHILIKAIADIDAKDNRGWTPLHLASFEGKTKIAHILIKAEADIEAKQEGGWTPLHFAAQEGKTKTADTLIKAGADIYAKTNNGKTALDIARQYKQSRIVAILENLQSPKSSDGQAPNVATAPAPEDSNVAEVVFENAWRSVVFIENNKGQGSGVIIRPNIVVTNCHVVDGGGIVVYKAKDRRTDKSKKYRATIRHRDEKNDFCLLDVSGLWGIAANVRRYDTLGIGESVYGIGAPQGLDLSLTSGLISQKRTESGIRFIQTDVAISPGSSGGGLFDRKGNLVGILTAKLVDEKVEGIGFAIPADLAL